MENLEKIIDNFQSPANSGSGGDNSSSSSSGNFITPSQPSKPTPVLQLLGEINQNLITLGNATAENYRRQNEHETEIARSFEQIEKWQQDIARATLIKNKQDRAQELDSLRENLSSEIHEWMVILRRLWLIMIITIVIFAITIIGSTWWFLHLTVRTSAAAAISQRK